MLRLRSSQLCEGQIATVLRFEKKRATWYVPHETQEKIGHLANPPYQGIMGEKKKGKEKLAKRHRNSDMHSWDADGEKLNNEDVPYNAHMTLFAKKVTSLWTIANQGSGDEGDEDMLSDREVSESDLFGNSCDEDMLSDREGSEEEEEA